MKTKRTISLLLCLCMTLGLLVSLTPGASAANTYTINGKSFTYETYSSQGDNCWNYANALYYYIWGNQFSSSRSQDTNYLRNLSAADLTLTTAHLKAYVSSAPLGAVIRVCSAATFNGDDNDVKGHSMILVAKSSDGFTVCNGGYLGHAAETTMTYEGWTNQLLAEGKEYIKYIKWPGGTTPYSGGSGSNRLPTVTMKDDSSVVTVKSTTSLSGASNAEKAWNYLKSQGYNDYGCAGIVGNLYSESGISPTNLQNSYESVLGYSDASYTAAVDNGSYSAYSFLHDGAGYGIAQWTNWARKERLYNLAQSRKTSIGDLGTQLVLLHQELQSYGLAYYLQNASSVQEASNIMLLKFEKPLNQSVENQNRRASVCQGYMDTYGKPEVCLVGALEVSARAVGNTVSVTYTVHVKQPGTFTISLTLQRPGSSFTTLVDNKRLSLSSDYTDTVSFTGKCGEKYSITCSVGDGTFVTADHLYTTPVNHSYTFTETPATCAKSGSRKGVCKYCGDVHTDVIKATGEHAYEWVTTVQPTYTANGKKEYKCAVCGHVAETQALPALTAPFMDVIASDYYYEPVMWALERKITSGTSPNIFDPDKFCTRAEIVTFLWRAAGSPTPASRHNPFTDVKASDWYDQAVLWAVEKKITSGTGDSTFTPQKVCTRAEAATFLWRAKGQPSATFNNKFKDISYTDYYTGAVMWAVEKGITNGTSATAFSPDAKCTRGQIATFLYRAYN